MIEYVDVPIGTGFPAGCALCGGTPAFEPTPLAAVSERLDAVASASPGGLDVSLSGLEAFSHPELPALIDAARRRGARRIRIVTDGRFLDQGGNAPGAYAAGVTHLTLVLRGGDAATHDRLTGHPGSFAAADRGARGFLAAGPAAVLSGLLPLCRHTVEHAPSAIAAFAAMGAIAVDIDATGIRAKPQSDAFIRAALETAAVNRVAAWVTGWAGERPALDTVAPWRVAEAVS